MTGGAPSNESWNEKVARLDREKESEENARRKEPGMVKVSHTIKTDDIFGIKFIGRKLKSLKAKMKKLLLLLLFVPLASCSINSASKIAPDGTHTKYFSGALGGKGGAVHGDSEQGGLSMASFYDNEKSFRDGVIGLVTYGVADVIGGVVKAGQAAKTAQHAATTGAGVANAKTAANVANTATSADLIKAVGVKGEVPISAVALPISP